MATSELPVPLPPNPPPPQFKFTSKVNGFWNDSRILFYIYIYHVEIYFCFVLLFTLRSNITLAIIHIYLPFFFFIVNTLKIVDDITIAMACFVLTCSSLVGNLICISCLQIVQQYQFNRLDRSAGPTYKLLYRYIKFIFVRSRKNENSNIWGVLGSWPLHFLKKMYFLKNKNKILEK